MMVHERVAVVGGGSRGIPAPCVKRILRLGVGFLLLCCACTSGRQGGTPGKTSLSLPELVLESARIDGGNTWRLTVALPPDAPASLQLSQGDLHVTLDGRERDGCVVAQDGRKIFCTLTDLAEGFHDLRLEAAPTLRPFRRTVDIGPWDWRNAVIYFILTDRFFDGDPTNDFDVDRNQKGFYHGGDFQGIIDKIGYLAELGVNAIWITPIVDNIDHPVYGAGFPDWPYHGYWGEDFTQVDRHLGDIAKLRELIEVAHRNGIKVLIDIVVNHAGYGSSWATKDEWVRSTELGTCQENHDPITDCIAGLPDFRTEKPEVAEFLRNVYLEWIERTGCDGFRVDTVKHVEHAFWKRFREEIKARYPDFFLLGEVYGGAAHDDYLLEYLSGDEMDACFDFGFSGSALSYFIGRMRTVAFDHWLRQRDHFPEGFVTSPYLDSHDEPGFLFRAKGRKEILRLAAALQMTVIGIPTIYYGDEIGRIGGKWPENRSDMPWGAEQDRELFAFYQRLITARRKHPVFGRGRHEALVIEPDAYAFLRYDPSDGAAAITALNRSAEETPLEIPLPEFLAGKSTWLDEMSGAHLSSEGGRLSLSLPPFGVAILAPVAADAMTSQRSARSAGRL